MKLLCVINFSCLPTQCCTNKCDIIIYIAARAIIVPYTVFVYSYRELFIISTITYLF